MKTLFEGLFLWLAITINALAADVSVVYKNKNYHLHATFHVEASAAQVMQVLTDFDNIADLNPAIIESETQKSLDENKLRVRTVIKDCILFFCKQITRVEDIDQFENEKLEAFIVPMLSDLRSGYAVWGLTEEATSTMVDYNASMQPKFWIPPIVRSYVLTKKFKQRVIESVELLQQKAQKNE